MFNALARLARPRPPSSSSSLVTTRLLASKPQLLIPNPRKNIPAEKLAPLQHESLFDFVRREGRWDECKDKVALRCSLNGFKPLTYGALTSRITAAAHALRALGFKQGDVINIHLHNCEQFVVAFFATAALGGSASTSNPVYTAPELAGQHLDSGSKFVLSSRAYAETVAGAVAENPYAPLVSYVEDADCFANAPPMDGPLPLLERPIAPLEDFVALPYSSGTTGKPKGVMLTHYNLTANTLQCRGALSSGGGGVTNDDTLIGVLPLFHIYGMTVLMCYTIVQQAELVLLSKFEPQAFLEAMQEHKVSVGFLVPPIILFLAKHPIVKGFDLSRLQWIMSGAAPLDAATQESLSAELKTPVFQGWGMTELSPIGCVGPAPAPNAPWRPEGLGSSGQLAPNTQGMIIDAETGESLPAGELGELVIGGPQVMKGYLGREEATAETIGPDGFLRTGDLAYYDEGGNIFIVDRLKELIKVKGLQVAPAEIEGRLLEIDEVADAAVIGIADERAGQLPKAYVVLQPGKELSADGVRAALSKTLAEYKLPSEIEFCDAVPKSASGKILRKDLRAAVASL